MHLFCHRHLIFINTTFKFQGRIRKKNESEFISFSIKTFISNSCKWKQNFVEISHLYVKNKKNVIQFFTFDFIVLFNRNFVQTEM